jgi:arginyl-tRNA synthetase
MTTPLYTLEKRLKDEIGAFFAAASGSPWTADVPLAPPPNREFGDLSTPVCLAAARILKDRPAAIAERLAGHLRAAGIPFVKECTVTGPGFLNVVFDDRALAAEVLMQAAPAPFGAPSPFGALPPRADAAKVVIEHTNINPNKAAHIGHLRNACLGDALARLRRRAGYQVEVQNYIDDTGTTVADIVLGLERLGRRPAPGEFFDHFCWDLYTDINEEYRRNPDLKEEQKVILKRIEDGDPEVAPMAKDIARRVVRGHLRTMWGLGVYYDLLTWESDIINLSFWRHVFGRLKDGGALSLETEGPNAGCWVVKLGDLPEFAGLENPDKILVRSNGTATYVAKDIAYQLWKFGVLGKDFRYAPFTPQPDGRTLWTSVSEPDEPGATGGAAGCVDAPGGVGASGAPAPAFGGAATVINVIDIRQKYLQDILRYSLLKLGFPREADNSVHFAYEVVSLSAETARELGVDVEAEEKAVYAMSGRKGIGVKADDLLARAREKARDEVARRHPEFAAAEIDALAGAIAVGAIRYYMVKYNINSVIVFDFAEALSMQGNTGPYLQYAHARANSILRKAGALPPGTAADIEIPAYLEPAETALVLKMAEFSKVLADAAAHNVPSLFADYAYSLATAFTDFYEKVKVLSAGEPERSFRTALVAAFAVAMRGALDTLGLPAPSVM